jgi:hypothetical protein
LPTSQSEPAFAVHQGTPGARRIRCRRQQIVELTEAGDLVITADIPLAAASSTKAATLSIRAARVTPRQHQGTAGDAQAHG